MARQPPKSKPKPAVDPRARATSYDVAQRAGVSQSAVSRAFTRDGSVSEETRKRVLEAARDLGYRPNAIARTLITRRSNLVGLILRTLTNIYYPEVAIEITRQCARRGSRVLLFTIDNDDEIPELLDQIWAYQIDGIIACVTLSAAQEKQCEAAGVPLVLYNRTPLTRSASAVGVDHAEGEARLVDALWAAGHRRFGLVGGPQGSGVARARSEAMRRRLSELGAGEVLEAGGDYTYESGADGLRDLLARAPHLDAVLCANDAMALGALDAARLSLGRRPPTDLSIVGFDGFGAGRWLAYDLTTMRQPVERMSEAAAALLFARIEDPSIPSERRTFLADLVPGGSARLVMSD
jgi:DNA-binding LacI/PurR family transcriptional regulator